MSQIPPPSTPLRRPDWFRLAAATIDRLPQKVSEARLRVLPTRVRQILFDQFSESEPLVEFTHQNQAAVRRNARTLEADLESGIEGMLKRPVLYFTHRVRDIGPVLNLIAADESALQEWEHLSMMDGSRVRQLRASLDLSEQEQRELARLGREEATAKAAFESFVVDNPLIALGPAIQELVGELGSNTDKKRDRPRVQNEADEFKKKLEDSAVRLGLPADTDLALFRPDEMLVIRLREQIKVGRSVATSISANAKSIRDENASRETLKNQQSASAPVSDPKPPQDQLGRLMPALGQLKEIERLEHSTAKESAQIKEKAAQLSSPVSDLEALALASLPTKDVIDEHHLAAETLEGERRTLEANLRESEQSLPRLQLRVDELSGGQLASSPEKIAAARLERDDHWLPLKSALLAESERLPAAETAAHVIGLDEGIRTADRLSDDAVLNADRLAKHAAALKTLKDKG